MLRLPELQFDRVIRSPYHRYVKSCNYSTDTAHPTVYPDLLRILMEPPSIIAKRPADRTTLREFQEEFARNGVARYVTIPLLSSVRADSQ